MSRTESLDAWMVLDRSAHPPTVLQFAQLGAQVEGTLPFVREITVERRMVASDLLPKTAQIIRRVVSPRDEHVVAEFSGTLVGVETGRETTRVTVSAPSAEEADRIAALLDPGEPPDPGRLGLWLWHANHHGPPSLVRRRVEVPRWEEIERNYPEPVSRVLGPLVSLRATARSAKLILWHGPPGTGKTTALRALISGWREWCQPHYIADPEAFFRDPSYISHVLTAPTGSGGGPGRDSMWKLLIAEDCDEYLRASARRDAGVGLGRLLNLADGLLGQGSRALILLTTNEEVGRLHPALSRPGRCLAAVEFPLFAPIEASRWLGRPVTRSLSLAELLEERGDIGRISGPPELVRPGTYL